jgi:ADP-ribosyl-[dinitrogen reductase] hydrolase
MSGAGALPTTKPQTPKDAIIGCILGTAVGDAVGLAAEGLSRRRQQKLFPRLSGPCLLGNRGMFSDDTEHTIMVAQALIESDGGPTLFTRCLARRMRIWLLGLPAGLGAATLQATIRLWFGVPPDRSGIESAGNGPAMRSALLGVCHGDEPGRLAALVRASSRMTHTDPRAETGALAVALAAHVAIRSEPHDDLSASFLRAIESQIGAYDEDLVALLRQAAASAASGQTTQQFADSIGSGDGVTGFIQRTVPVAIHAWLRNPADLRAGVLEVVRCGGDTDSTAAIVGCIIGASMGKRGIPADWLTALCEWPATVEWMERLGTQLGTSTGNGAAKPLALPYPTVLARNLFFLVVVVAQAIRRMLPPY